MVKEKNRRMIVNVLMVQKLTSKAHIKDLKRQVKINYNLGIKIDIFSTYGKLKREKRSCFIYLTSPSTFKDR